MKKLSVLIAGRHATSLSLEEDFIDALKQIAKAQKKSMNDIITEIDATRENENLSSAVRIYILKTVQNTNNIRF